MFIYTYTEAQGPHSRRVAGEIDHVLKPAFGDRPGANGHQSTGPLLSVKMLQEYEAASRELLGTIAASEAIKLGGIDDGTPGLTVKSPCGLTLCHAVQGTTVLARIDVEELHFHQQWSGAPMEVIDRNHIVEASAAFLKHAPQWREQLAAAFKADSKGVKMRNMAMNNMDAYLARYFDGTGITYYSDKRHADGHKAHLLIYLNSHKTLDLPIPHDNFINHLDMVKPHMTELALMARDGHFVVRSEVRDDWQQAPAKQQDVPPDDKPSSRGWLQRWLGKKQDEKQDETRSALQVQVDAFFNGKAWQYHLTEDEEEDGHRKLHVRLNGGRAMIIDLTHAGDALALIEHDMSYAPRLVELLRLFPLRITGPRKNIEWVIPQATQQ